MTKKCGNCKKFHQVGNVGRPGCKMGLCMHFHSSKTPFFVKSITVRQDQGKDCDCFEPKNT